MRQLTVSLLNINEAALTLDILEKLANLRQLGWQLQLVLVDNGSRPEELQRLVGGFTAYKGNFEELLLISASHNLGAMGGRNMAFKLASYERLLVLDNDVILPEGDTWLERLWLTLENDEQAAIAGPALVFAKVPDIVQVAGIALTATGRVGYLHRGHPVSQLPAGPTEVVASPSACWLIRRQAQQAIGLLSDEFYPVQYEDVDFCIRLKLAGWKVICERDITIKHIENVTTRNLQDHPFARLTVRQAIRFKEKWLSLLPQLATITEKDIHWALKMDKETHEG